MSLTCSIETAAVCPLTGHRAVAWYQMLKRAALQFTIRQLHHFSSASALDLISFSSSTSSSFQYANNTEQNGLVNIQDRRRFSGKIIFILFEIRKSAYLVSKLILLFYTSLSWIWGWYLVLAVKWDQVAIECKYVHCTSSGQAQESCRELQRPDPSLRIICQSEQFLQM